MHIIIPMSGIGKRFVDAGYTDPKPLIKINGKPIIQHVVELFPGESRFTFVCNEEHLSKTCMRSVLNAIAPDCEIVAIEPHKLGPVYAVSCIKHLIDDNEEVIVNYCDFGTYWDYCDFLTHTRERNADGAVVAYRDFHPHMLGATNYAFMREQNQWMLEIQEKKPFTDNRMQEFASNGTYYFKKGIYVKRYFDLLIDKNHHLNGEYYVSLIFNLLVRDQLKVSIYKVQHMLQWGTPADVEEYELWSKYFDLLIASSKNVLNKSVSFVEEKPQKNSVTLIPLAGKGSRFVKENYTRPKPLICVNGKAMIVQASSQLPASDHTIYVCLKEHIDKFKIDTILKKYQVNCEVVSLDEVTQGQAITCEYGLKSVPSDHSILIAACDNGMLWDGEKYKKLISNTCVDAIIWTFKNHPATKNSPQMYGWVNVDGDKATSVSVKKAISSNPENDHAIVGTFYFRKKSLFDEALRSLIDKNIRVNNEYYVDSMMGVLIEKGYDVRVFEIDSYVGWGTPNDYQTYMYWQSYFHKSPNHQYLVDNDPTANPIKIEEIKDSFHVFNQEHR